MKNIVITGATSFIGIHLIRQLTKDNNNKLHIIVRENNKKKEKLKKIEKEKNIDVYKIDMDEYFKIKEYINFKPDILIHLSWNGTRKPQRDDEILQENNYLNSIDLFENMVELGCKKIINIGSQAEYGISDKIISEDDETSPNTWYGIYKLKLCNEMFNRFKEKDLNFYHIRVFSIYGIGDDDNTLIMSSIKKLKQNMDLELTKSSQNWNFLNVNDLVKAIEIFVKKDDIKTGIYNIASKETKQLKEYIEELKDIMGSKSKLLFGEISYPKEGKVSINPDITKIQSNTQWREEITFEQGIKEIINLYEEK